MSDSLYYRTADIESLLADRAVQQLLELLDEHPDWSVQEFADHLTLLANGQQVLTQQQVKTILIRLHVYTPSQRGMLTTMVEDWWDNDTKRKHILTSYPSLVPLIQYKRACLEKQDKPPAKASGRTPSGTDYERVDLTTLLSDRAVQQLLELAEQHPGWSIADILSIQRHNELGQHILTYQQARTILRRLHLETVSQRRLRLAEMGEWEQSSSRSHNLLKKTLPDLLRYLTSRRKYQAWLAEDFWKKEQKQARTINSTEQASQSYQPQAHIQTHHASPVATTHIPHAPVRMPAPVFPPPSSQPQQPSVAVPQYSFTQTEQATFKQFDRFFHLAKQFSLTALVSFLIFFTGSLFFDWLFHTQGIFTRIGMLFSFTALSCGLFFFLYSLKYYLTVALILSYSRQTGEERGEQTNDSFFARLFGLSPPARAAAHKSGTKPLRLLSDLTGVVLERSPFVSIQVATYNEKRVIDRFLLAATSIEYENYEIIVADDSTDETVQLLEQWKNHPKVKVSHRQSREGFKGGALKEALKLTDPRTEFLLIFDADFIPYPDTITQFLKYFQATIGSLQPEKVQVSPIAAVQGYQWHILNKSENWITKGVRSEYAGSYVMERAGTQLYTGLEQISGSVYMLRKDVISQIGWGTSLTEDFELTLKLYAKGYKVVYTPYLQAPAEAASTIKRLIRQRMRWAEGHSFNIKQMFWPLLTSPKLTIAEKFEFLYLTPYYLQAFLFLLGTTCWFIAEVLFRVQLPFWPETFGWSLVLTNLFALPLMNMVGLFFEQAEERDYLGLFSFILISYIIAPFQAFAAVKGFLEKEEGPWFRTPKTGKITDNFTPGRFYRFVKGILGTPAGRESAAEGAFLSRRALPSLALAVSFRGSSSAYARRPSKLRWRGRSILAVFVIIALLLNYFSFATPMAQANGGNPHIEQQINLIDQAVTSGTAGSATGMILIDTTKYSGTVHYYFEVVAKDTGGSGSVTLTYNAGGGTTPSGGSTQASPSITSLVYQRFRTTSFSPTGTQVAYISAVGATTKVQAARIIIVQTNTDLISNTETQVEVGNNDSIANSSSTALTNPKYFKYGGTGVYDGALTINFEATIASGTNLQTTTAELRAGTTNCSGTLVGSVTTTSSTWSRQRTSSPITLDSTGATTYQVCIKATSGNALIANAKVIIDQSNAGGLTKLETYEEYTNTVQSYTAGAGDIGTFSTSGQGQLPAIRENGSALSTTASGTNYIYYIGGDDNANAYSTVYRSTVDALGNAGTFATSGQAQLPHIICQAGGIIDTTNNYIYILGGFGGGATYYSTVYKSTIDSSGNAGTFATTSQKQLPVILTDLTALSTTISGTNYLYVIGGNDNANAYSTVYKSQIDSSGNAGTFATSSQAQFPVKITYTYNQPTLTIGGTNYIYVLGGENYPGGLYSSAVYKATVDSSANVGTFSTSGQTQLPVKRLSATSLGFTMSGTSYIYMLGGEDGSSPVSTVYKATVDSSANVGTFNTTNQGQLPIIIQNLSNTTLTIGGTTYIYVLGGYTNTNGAYSTVYKATINPAFNAFGYDNLYESGNWAGGTPAFTFEATLKNNGATYQAQLNPGALGTVNTGNVNYALQRSGSITPVDATEYDAEMQTATVSNAWLVIDVTQLSTPENLLPLLPLIIFLPKIMESIKKRRKLRLAMQQSLLVNSTTAVRTRKQLYRARSRSLDPG